MKAYELKRLFMNASNVMIELANRAESSLDDEARERNIEALKRIRVYADNLIKDLEEGNGKKDE